MAEIEAFVAAKVEEMSNRHDITREGVAETQQYLTDFIAAAGKAGSIVRRQLDELAEIADDQSKRGKHLERMYAAFMRETAQIVTEHGHMLTEAQDAVDKMAKKGAEQNKATEQKFEENGQNFAFAIEEIKKVDRERKAKEQEVDLVHEDMQDQIELQ